MPKDYLWEHYNARGLSPEMVARSFIPPRQFSEVARSRNSVLLGPRGSGKTTLLRMLDPRALGTWADPHGATLRESVDYAGVFVPVDAAWVSSLENTLRPLGADIQASAQMSIYALAIARALVDTMLWRVSSAARCAGSPFALDLARGRELELVTYLGNLWLPRQKIASLLELRLLLTQELATLPRRLIDLTESEQRSLLLATDNPIKLAAAGCDGFNLLVEEPERKWAILCDELEIAPRDVQRHLFASLRATPQPLLLKLALTPAMKLPATPGLEHPLPAHDYDSISLSYGTREEGVTERSREGFCNEIWRGLVISRYGISNQLLMDASVAFDFLQTDTHVSTLIGRKAERTTANMRFGSIFRALAAIDSSFADYLARKGVNVLNLDDGAPGLLDTVVRKVRPIVEIRSFYLKTGDSAQVKRASRRSLLPYCGANRIFALSEAHPRWLKSTLSAMLSDTTETIDFISAATQNRELKFAVSRIVARLKSFPLCATQSTYSVIEKVGTFFADQVLGAKFSADPILSFVVDEGVDENVLTCLGNALYIGALVPMDMDSHNYLIIGLINGRFRISNWLAPHFRLPLVAGKSIKLSTLLARGQSTLSPIATNQLTLGLENES